MKTLMSLMICLAAGFSMNAEPLAPGSKAPELQINNWVKGGPVKIADGKGKNIYVIEFWATWCPPCRMSIPHLSKLQKEYKDKGLIVVGITNEELPKVKQFVKTQTDMNYNVAVDTEGTTYAAYMEGVQGIPHAFIVDKEGRIAWAGHPMEMDAVLEHMVKGDFNPENAEKIAELTKKLQAARSMEDAIKLAKEILVLDSNNDLAYRVLTYIARQPEQRTGIVQFLNKLIQNQPDMHRPYFVKIQMLTLDKGQNQDEIRKTITTFAKNFKNNATKLNSMAWYILNDMPFPSPYLKEALEASKLAVKNSDSGNTKLKAGHIDTLARCYYSVGRVDLAIKEQEKAINLLKGTQEEKAFTDTLNYYKQAQQIGKNIK